MPFERIINDVEFHINPSAHYPEDKEPRIVEACGILPLWMTLPCGETLSERLEESYQFFMGWHEGQGASVDQQGAFCYPEDAPQYPFLKAQLQSGGEVIYVYPRSIVAVVVDGKLVKWSRFD